jgi:hypothetical protein
MITFLIILGIVWSVCTVFNFWYMWNDEKDCARRDGYISFTLSDLFLWSLGFVVAPLYTCIFIKMSFDEGKEIFRIQVKRRK